MSSEVEVEVEVDVPDAEVIAAREELIRKRLAEIQETATYDLVAIRTELKRRQWLQNGPLWVEERLAEFLWSAQKRVVHAVAANRKTLVQSCHDVGKSYIAARIAAWWIDSHLPGEAFVVTTAPTTAQVKAILWREIGRAHTRGRLNGRVNQTEWYITPVPGGREELVAFGRKPDEYDPAAFQGIHARFVLVIIDEANGVRGPLHDAADSLIANDNGKLLMIGNPDDPTGEFYEASKPGSGVEVIKINAFDSPNFTGEETPDRVRAMLIGKAYVEERRKRWASRWFWVDANGTPSTIAAGVRCVAPPEDTLADTHPYWQSKILGEFPKTVQGIHTLIPLPLIRAAQAREIVPTELDPSKLGVDVGGGGDSSTLAHAHGGRVRVTHENRNPDTMELTDLIIEQLVATGATSAQVDEIGIGHGVVDRGRQLEKPFIGINVGRASHEPDRFSNLRAQFWWSVRTLFELGQIDIDPDDKDLEEELLSLRYKPGDRGKITMESKDDARRRGVKSPNRADALMLAVCDPSGVVELDSTEVDAFGTANTTLVRPSTWSFMK